ncbi:hypothetical protein [Streptomyces sp. NBC_00005]|uniref:hypothetical protein n=1 Tax=Streptomyces sp. NBC_00005 TaxID=2903609 RepID=UPI0032468B5A
MAVDQLPGRMREFVNYLNDLLARLDQGVGWCAVFWQRDPDGMRACLEGREVPPWDVVEAVLQDLAAQYGPGVAAQEKERARALHAAALTAYDARPGGREALGDRLDVMLREQRYAAERQAELSHLLASAATQQEADAHRLDLAWARDDHERATARCAELRSRMAELDHHETGAQAAAIRRGPAGEGAVFRIDRNFPPAETHAGGRETHGSGFPQQRDSYAYDRGSEDGRRPLYEADPAGEPRDPYGRAPAGTRQGSAGPGSAGMRSGSYAPGGADGQRPLYEADAAGESHDVYGRVPAGTRQGSPGPGPGPGSGSAGMRDGSYAPESAAAQRGPYEVDAAGESHDPYGRSPAGTQSGLYDSESGDGQWGYETGARQHRAPFEAANPGGAMRPASYDVGFPSPPRQGDAHGTSPGLAPHSAPEASAPEQTAPAPKQRKRRRGSARFAGMAEEEAAPVVAPTAAPTLPAPEVTGRTPRGARFAGAAEVPAQSRQVKEEPLDSDGARAVVGAVEGLVRLRAEGRSGEAHALLVEAAHWPAARFPLLAAELQRAGLGADWATLLWEAASLPADKLVAAADALVAAGRGPDGEKILRQGVARPATEIGQAVLGLTGEGRRREVRALLDAYVRVRTPEEAARSAEPDPQTLVPLLLEAAQGVSEERHWDLVHALRVAGFAA